MTVTDIRVQSSYDLLFFQRQITSASVAISAIVLYDYTLTLGKEIRYAWTQHWSLAKVLFFIIRYTAWAYALFLLVINFGSIYVACRSSLGVPLRRGYIRSKHLLQRAVGHILGKVANVAPGVIMYCTEFTLLLRVHALYLPRVMTTRILIVAEGLILFLLIISWATDSVSNDIKVIVDDNVASGISIDICTYAPVPDRWFSLWIPILLLELVLLALVLRKGWEHRQMIQGFRIEDTGPSIINQLVKGSTFYFTIMYTTYLVTFAMYCAQLYHPDSATLLLLFQPFILASTLLPSVLIGHIYLDLRHEFESHNSTSIPGGGTMSWRVDRARSLSESLEVTPEIVEELEMDVRRNVQA